jgi:hypothetical protein
VAIRIIKVPHLASSRNMTANAFASLGIWNGNWDSRARRTTTAQWSQWSNLSALPCKNNSFSLARTECGDFAASSCKKYNTTKRATMKNRTDWTSMKVTLTIRTWLPSSTINQRRCLCAGEMKYAYDFSREQIRQSKSSRSFLLTFD